MALEKFPYEVLEIIFGYLGVLDRLAASSVCKHWYYASLNINFWKDVAVCIDKKNEATEIDTKRAKEGLNVLMNCERPFSCAVFKDVKHEFRDCHPLFLHAVEVCKVAGWRLGILHFENCSLSGPCMAQILVECPNLKRLSAINCESLFSSVGWLGEPEEIARLKSALQNVKEVDLSRNKSLSDMFVARLAQVFTNVESLSFEECPISFESVVFKRFYPLREIEPYNHILTFSWIKELIVSNATSITSLNFNETRIDNRALKALAQIEGLQLKSIFLSNCGQITTKGIRALCKCQRKLKNIHLPCTIALNKVLPEICANLLELREFCIGHHWPPDEVSALMSLDTSALSKLIKLKLDRCCEIVVLKFIDSLRNEAYPRLRHLNLHQDKIDDGIFIYMIPYLLHITYLDLGRTLISDKSLIMVSTHLVHLKVLRLLQCKGITDQGLTGKSETRSDKFLSDYSDSEVPKEDEGRMSFGNHEFLKWLVFDDHPVSVSNLKGLRELNIYDISGISDDGIKAAVMFKELRSLYIGGCSKITDDGLEAIGQNNKSIEVLSVRCSENVTESGIAKLLGYLPRLKLLDLRDCKKLTDSNTFSRLMKEYSFKLKYLL